MLHIFFPNQTKAVSGYQVTPQLHFPPLWTINVHKKIAIAHMLTQSSFNKPARPFVSMMQQAKRTRHWTMLKTSVTIFVCLMSHVRRICGCLSATVRKSATRSHDKCRKKTKSFKTKKKHYYMPFQLFLRSKVKTEASYLRKNKMGNHLKMVHSL